MSSDRLRDLWKSMGAAFEAGEIELPVPPEEIILSTVSSPEFPRNKQMIRLMLGWLAMYRELIHVERLKTQSPKLDARSLAVLGGVAHKQAGQDHRWKAIVRLVEKRLGDKPLVDPPADPAIQIERKGLDPDFTKLGIEVFQTTATQARKFRARRFILDNNPWLKNRLLFGANLRADVATVMALSLAPNAYGASQLLGCSRDAANRNWRALAEAGWPAGWQPVR